MAAEQVARCTYKFLGSSGLKVSNICLGTMTFGERQDGLVQCSDDDALALLDRYVELGGNFIDTANAYQQGASESIIGKWLQRSPELRKKIILATKARFPMGSAPNDMGLSRKHLRDAVEDSLERLGTKYIDLYQIHIWDDAVPIEETLSALNDLVRAGKILYVGASNLTGWQLQKIVMLCKEKGYDRWITLQQQYSLLCRESEFEALQVCKNEGIGVLPWSPLKGGLLSGKYKRNQELPADSRLKWVTEKEGRANQAAPDVAKLSDREWAVIGKLETISQQCGKSVAQVSLRWLLQKEVVSSVIIGAKNMRQLEDNMGAAAGWELSKEQMEELDKASLYDVPYPYEMVWRANKDRQK